ncbi:MAG TPA: RNA ligase family protein [Burkholderiales bacterium]|nr:RNA ligase family protein [Burkholderiales bacterium]
MKLNFKIKDNSINYTCTVVKIEHLFPIEGADKIQRCNILGNDIVVSKELQVGTIMLYFVSGTRLNPDYCKFNNLYSDSALNIDDKQKGYINNKCKVSAVKLRNVISNGMLMPLESLDAFHLDIKNSLKVGDSFTDINEYSICEKYIVVVKENTHSPNKLKNVKRFNRLIDDYFQFHNCTEQLPKNIHKLNPDDIIGIHYKKHGVSAVFANIPTLRPLKWWEKLLKRWGVKIEDKVYDIIYSSRKVIKNKYIYSNKSDLPQSKDIWGVVDKEIGHLIPKNWNVFGEIVGFTPKGSSLQPRYDYGCKQGEHKFYVYKISIVNPDGKLIYLTDKQIQEWCDSVGLLFSDTLLYYGRAINRYNFKPTKNDPWTVEKWRERFLEVLKHTFTEKDCKMCVNKVPMEGIVLRIEKLNKYEAYKLKSQAFFLLESKAQDNEVTNLEDNQDES